MHNFFTVFPTIIVGLIFISGLLNAINPRITWRLFESWKAAKEPSKAFFLTRRIGGIFAMIVSISIMIFPYLASRDFPF
jgi:hypothetical protein